MPRTRKVWVASANASLGGFLYGYNIIAFNVAQENVAHALDWDDNAELLISFGTGLLLLGGLIGSVMSGYIANHSGRRKALLLADLMAAVGSALTAVPATATVRSLHQPSADKLEVFSDFKFHLDWVLALCLAWCFQNRLQMTEMSCGVWCLLSS